MVDPKVLKKFGCDSDRLRAIFTSTGAAAEPCASSVDPNKAALTADDKTDAAIRKRFECRIRSRILGGIQTGIQNNRAIQAVDMAWDSPPIQKETIPLMLYAMGKLDVPKLWNCLSSACGEETAATFFHKRAKKDELLKPNIPRICNVSIDLMRSYITRRHAAMDALWSNLWPLLKYDPRGQEPVAMLRGDALSQRIDIMSDAYNYRHFTSQCRRDMLLYGQSLIFPRSSWDRKTAWRFKRTNTGENSEEVESYITREGVELVNPHPSRWGYDLSSPLANINTDTGPKWLFFWDINRYGTLLENQSYWNLKNIIMSTGWVGIVNQFTEYFGYYFDPCVLRWPACGMAADPSISNDREVQVGMYSADMKDMGVLTSNYFEKINPKVEGIGEYDGDVWMKLIVAGDYTVIGGEFLPSLPAAYGGINWNDSRLANQSMGMALLAYQDQGSNILSHMLQQIRSSLVQLWLIDKDSLDENIRKEFEKNAENKDWWVDPKLLIYSATKLRDLGIQDPKQAFAIVQSQLTNVVEGGLKALGQLLNLADRLLILSPNELGQPNPREVAAREVQEIATSVQSIYSFINQGPREQIAALKELLYESLICCADENITVPIEGRYTMATIEAAGFKLAPGVKLKSKETEDLQVVPVKTPIMGNLRSLRYDYYFNSRDGAERPVNSQAAQVLTQLVAPLLQDAEIRQALGKERVFGLVNTIIRLSGAPTNEQIELADGEDTGMPVPQQAPPPQDTGRIERLEQMVMQLAGQLQGAGIGAPAATPPAPPPAARMRAPAQAMAIAG